MLQIGMERKAREALNPESKHPTRDQTQNHDAKLVNPQARETESKRTANPKPQKPYTRHTQKALKLKISQTFQTPQHSNSLDTISLQYRCPNKLA